ncbi:hypothetical protein [Scytonema sp. PCC 10023]|uniref:hypothetical protein n=1 Tax=Scytonema sp. PCC 10023 TaxID=1680591 RepID=UPI0039C5CB9B
MTDDEQAEQLVTSGLSEISLNERVDQLVNEEMARCSKGAAQRAISFAAAPWAIVMTPFNSC